MNIRVFKHVVLLLLFAGSVSCKQDNRQTMCIGKGEDHFAYLCDGAQCTDELCLYYQQIWKELFIEENDLREDYFNRHILPCSSRLEIRKEYTFYIISYKILVDWAVSYKVDQFIVKYENGLPDFNILPDTYLTKEDIKKTNRSKITWSSLGKLPDHERLKYSSFESAIELLKHQAQVNELCLWHVGINPDTGDWILETWAQFKNEYNSCIFEKLNLITGEIDISKGQCDPQ